MLRRAPSLRLRARPMAAEDEAAAAAELDADLGDDEGLDE